MSPKSKQTKVCETCNRTKGTHLFYKRAGNKDGLSKECKACYKLSPAYRKQQDRRYRRDFNISIDEYETLFDQQGGRCYICGKQPRNRKLAVDHDHAEPDLRLAVRGLLCRNCNEYLGHIGDSVRAANRLREYLTRAPRFE